MNELVPHNISPNATENELQATEPLKLRLHYCLNEENLHSMNAEVFNECQKAFLSGIKRSCKYIEESIEIRVCSKSEGGVIDELIVCANNPVVIALVTAFATSFFTTRFRPTQSVTDEVKSKLSNVLDIRNDIKNGALSQEEFDYVANSDNSLKRLKSNFFKKALEEEPVITVELSIGDPPVVISVPSEHFNDFILKDETETDEIARDCKIYVVSPILVKGFRGSWKGICDNETIDFKISDKNFLDQVFDHSVRFGNGTYINCRMETATTVDKFTSKTMIVRDVVEIINYGEDSLFEKPILKRLPKKEENKEQMLFEFEES